MGLNWGGFASGLSQGMALAKQYQEADKEYKLKQVREEGMAEAQAARQAEIDAKIRDTSNAQNVTPEPTGQAQAPQTGQAAPDTADVQTQAVSPQMPPTAAPNQIAMPPQVAAPAQAAPAMMDAAQPAPPAMQGMPVPQGAEQAPSAAPMAAGGMPQQKRFMVDGVGFDDQASARKQAEKSVPTMTEFLRKTMVPKMQEAYIAQGNPEKAAAWGKWAADSEHEEHAKTWAKTYAAAQAGDIDGAAAGVIKMYKNYDDGISLVSHEKVKDKDGNVTGFNVKVKTDATGETRSQFIDKAALTEMGLAQLSPVQMFEQVYKNQSAASALQAKARIDAQNDARTATREEARDIRKETRAEAADVRRSEREAVNADRKQGYELEKLATAEDLKSANYGKAEKAKLQTKIDILRENGMSADAVKAIVPNLLGVDGYKKTTDPAERRALITSDLMKNDPRFAQEKDPTKQAAKVDQLMGVIYGPQGDAGAKPGQAAPQAPSATAPAQDRPKGVPVWDAKAGKIVYR